ncbi:hypothetical protein D1113_02625, partial [Mycoplasmopsis gallopavonis]
ALAFVKETARNAASDEVILKAFKGHMQYYLNNAYVRAFAKHYLQTGKFKKANGEDSNKTFAQVAEKINAADSTSVISKVFDVLTSRKTIANGGLGIFKTQATRPGVSNPQFGNVWETWNGKTFGANEVFKSIAQNANVRTEADFIAALEKRLSDNMSNKLKALTGDQKYFIVWSE